MNLRRLLIHRCTVITPGLKVGETEYGKPIFKDVKKEDVPCRADSIQRTIATDAYSTDIVTKNVLFLSPDEQFNENTKFENIRDQNGHPVLLGAYRFQESKPAYGKRRLHHHEVSLEKVSGSNG